MKGKGTGKWFPFGMKGKGSGKQSPFDRTHLKDKAKVEAANRPPPQLKEKEKKDRDVGNADKTDTCLRTVKTWPLCMMKRKKKNMNMTKKLTTGWTGAVTYDDLSYGDYCDYCQDP